jgi:Asp-tRNA(Asn)/Glu-tRNA(Gln) amidotransferase C subunit
MSQVEEVLQHVSELSKAEQLRVYIDLHRRLREDVDQLGFLKLSEDALKDWDNEEDDVYNGI